MPVSRFFRKLGLLLPGIALLSGLAGWAGYRYSLSAELETLQQAGQGRLALYASSLEAQIEKFAFLPATLGLNPEVMSQLRQAAAASPDGPLSRDANRFLTRLNRLAGTRVIYTLDPEGRVMASSNWQQPDSYVGEDLSYRAYFNEAISGERGRFFGVGTTRGEPGYYLSSPLYQYGVLAGVAVVKIGLDQLEQTWADASVPVLVSDQNGVVILASNPDWRFKTMQPLDAAKHEALQRSQQYFQQPLSPLGLHAVSDRWLPHVPLESLPSEPGSRYVTQQQTLGQTGWTLTMLTPVGQISGMAWTRGAMAALVTSLLCILLLLWQQRRAVLLERLRAKAALQRAHDELERKVEARTRSLETTRDELVHAGKMAVIGQLSAELAHELSQPLAALRTLSGNAGRFLERGELDAARGNLSRIETLVDTMGGLISRLKLFARKSEGDPQPVDVRRAVDNALFLLEPRLRQVGASLRIMAGGGVQAHCDANRLEQVLVNLIGNALDAVEGRQSPAVRVSTRSEGGRVQIEVADNGPGLPNEVLAHLFEPFFTTKEAGRGLGLGLAISAGIVRSFGGTLTASSSQAGGALFTVDLPAAAPALRS